MKWMLLLPLAASAVIGCADSKYSQDFSDTAASGASDGGDTSDEADEDTAPNDTGKPLPEPVWYALNAELLLSKGELSGLFRLQVFGEDTELEPNCTSERAIEAAALLPTTPDRDIYQWWELSTGPDSSGCDGAEALPGTFYLGLGALHPELLPALSRSGLEPEEVAGSLYGVFASIPGSSFCGGDVDSACVYGYAGTAAGFAGKEDAAAEAPLPDGSYVAIAAYLFPAP